MNEIVEELKHQLVEARREIRCLKEEFGVKNYTKSKQRPKEIKKNSFILNLKEPFIKAGLGRDSALVIYEFLLNILEL